MQTHSVAPALGPSRARVLDELSASDVALGVMDVAERMGLHPNTARFHLEALVAAELAERSRETAMHAGRPRILYLAKAGASPAGMRSYRLLAEILAGYVAAHTRRPSDAAAAAGREWGRSLAERPPPFHRTSTPDALAQLLRVLADLGFHPELTTTGRRSEIRLAHCPFREIAEVHGDVVCSVHLGLMQGLLAELGTPLSAERVEPFGPASACRVRITR